MRWTLETLLWYKVKLTRHRGTWWLPHRLGGQSRTHHTYKQNRPAPYQSKTHLTLTTAGEAWPPPPPPTLSSPPPCLTFLPTKETSTRGHTERSSLCNTRVVKPCFVAAAVLCNSFRVQTEPTPARSIAWRRRRRGRLNWAERGEADSWQRRWWELLCKK